MKLAKTFEIVYQIRYINNGIDKISIHLDARSAEEELRNFKRHLKKEQIKEAFQNIEVYEVHKLKIINLGKNL